MRLYHARVAGMEAVPSAGRPAFQDRAIFLYYSMNALCVEDMIADYSGSGILAAPDMLHIAVLNDRGSILIKFALAMQDKPKRIQVPGDRRRRLAAQRRVGICRATENQCGPDRAACQDQNAAGPMAHGHSSIIPGCRSALGFGKSAVGYTKKNTQAHIFGRGEPFY